jgi:hypothetical protein
LAYVFWAPYRQRAGCFELTATALTLSAVLALFLAGLTYVEYRRVGAGICVARQLIAIGSLASAIGTQLSVSLPTSAMEQG